MGHEFALISQETWICFPLDDVIPYWVHPALRLSSVVKRTKSNYRWQGLEGREFVSLLSHSISNVTVKLPKAGMEEDGKWQGIWRFFELLINGPHPLHLSWPEKPDKIFLSGNLLFLLEFHFVSYVVFLTENWKDKKLGMMVSQEVEARGSQSCPYLHSEIELSLCKVRSCLNTFLKTTRIFLHIK